MTSLASLACYAFIKRCVVSLYRYEDIPVDKNKKMTASLVSFKDQMPNWFVDCIGTVSAAKCSF
jgi:hypothetical protein